MKKLILTILILVPFITKAQITLIPDQNFEHRLIVLNIDSDGIKNGQMLTSDALAINDLNLSTAGINDLTGLEDFTNLEKLNCFRNSLNGSWGPPFGSINVSNLVNLKELDVRASHLNSIDVSKNILLEQILIGNEVSGDVLIINDFTQLDLSNNPNIKYIYLYNLFNFNYLNLRNHTKGFISIKLGNNNNIAYNVCIEVNSPGAATNGSSPYDTWVIDNDQNGTHYFSDNCALSIEKFVNDNFKIFPNPATEYVTIEQKTTDGVTLQSVQILDSSGKWIKSVKDNFNQIDISNLSKGMYLFVIQTDKGNKTEKIMIK